MRSACDGQCSQRVCACQTSPGTYDPHHSRRQLDRRLDYCKSNDCDRDHDKLLGSVGVCLDVVSQSLVVVRPASCQQRNIHSHHTNNTRYNNNNINNTKKNKLNYEENSYELWFGQEQEGILP